MTVLRTEGRPRVHPKQGGPSRTRQAHKDETDINRIVGAWRETGIAEHVNLNRSVYGDFSNTKSYLDARVALQKADQIFMALPARVRARVDNEPGKLIDFVMDPANDVELQELGLKNKVKDLVEPEIPAAPPAAPEALTKKGTEPAKTEDGTSPTS